jgi:multiple sugar transport system ATP-binding protein
MVRFAEHSLPVPPGLDLSAYSGGGLVLGLRPADFEDAAHAEQEGLPTLDVRADVVEELGSEMNVIFRVDTKPVMSESVRAAAEAEGADTDTVPLVAGAGQTICTARVSSRSGSRAGEPVRLAIPPDRLHFFDGVTGDAIYAAAG